MARQTTMARVRARPKWQKALCCGAIVVFGAFSAFMFVKDVIMGCGCPAGYEYSDGRDSTSCSCNGDTFTCEYECSNDDGSTNCFKGREGIDCAELDWTYEGTQSVGGASEGGEGTVLCPTMPSNEYCDCGSDCGGPHCICDEANVASCCGR